VSTEEPVPQADPPPRAFTQGVGLVFQWLGVTLFVVMMFVCCTSSLLSKDTATHSNLTNVGMQFTGGSMYTAQQAITLSVTLGVFFGMALAGLGLGFQAQNRWTPAGALILNAIGSLFWTFQSVFFGATLHSIVLSGLCGILAIFFIVCFAFSFGAMVDMRRNPPPAGFENLPTDYKVPYSHMHEDPPEVRLAAELEQRRRRLEVQQKELEMLEQKLRRRMKDDAK
jgi:hypothetical protein